MDNSAGSTVYAYYSLGRERDRLSVDARGVLECEQGDLMPLHVEQLDAARRRSAAIRAGGADARNMDLVDESVDAELLLGPIYHLRARTERIAALREARRRSPGRICWRPPSVL